MNKINAGNMSSHTGTTTGTARRIDSDEAYVMVAGTFVATIKVEVSFDGGTTYVEFQSTTVPVVSNKLPPCTHVRTRCSAFTSGQADSYFGGRDLTQQV
jgi:hypothetical protein